MDELKKVTFCGNCGKKGHWREDCTEPAREGGRRDRDKGQKMNAFAYLGLSEGAGDSIAFLAQNFVNYQFTEHASFLELDPGQAIVDPGASQDLIGLHSYNKPQQKLAEVGLKTIKLKEAPAKASGVGGAAKTLFMALAPCVLGGQPGVIKLTVVDGDVPQLLSIGLLEYGQAIIDTGADKIDFKKFNTSAKMTRLPSGHRTLDVIEWGGSKFPIPSSLAETFGLKEGDFNLPSSDRRAYTAARPLSMELSCFFSQVGLDEKVLHRSEVTCDQVLGNFVSLKDFAEVSHELIFRTSWLALDCEACLIERNAQRNKNCFDMSTKRETCDGWFASELLEITDFPLNFCHQHWSRTRIISLFSEQEADVNMRNLETAVLSVGPCLAASSETERSLRDFSLRAQYADTDLTHGGSWGSQRSSQEVQNQIRSGSRESGEPLVSLCPEAPDLEPGPGAQAVSWGLHHVEAWSKRGANSQLPPAGGQAQASEGVRDKGGQSTRHVDSLLPLSDQDGIPEIWQGQSSSRGAEDQGCGHRDLRLLERGRRSENAHGLQRNDGSGTHHAGPGECLSRSEPAAVAEHGSSHVAGHAACCGGISSGPEVPDRGSSTCPGETGYAAPAAISEPAAHHAADGSNSPAGRCVSGAASGRASSAAGSRICDGPAASFAGRGGLGSDLRAPAGQAGLISRRVSLSLQPRTARIV